MGADAQAGHEARTIGGLQDRLIRAYQGRRTPQEVTATVNQAFSQFDQVPIRDFIPLLVEHLARDRLGRG